MKMRDDNFLQKLKNNAFYVALGLGLIAVLAVVAVYTVERRGTDLAKGDMDLNQVSDYISNEDVPVADVDGSIMRNDSVSGITTETKTEVADDQNTDLAVNDDKDEEQTTSEEIKESDIQKGITEEPSVAVAADTGELNFTSDKAIGWPVQGKVIIPYSMETTVYFETLDQYQCSSAMMIAAGKGTTVQNAYLGQVTKITSDDTYGNMVTLYIGNDYSIVYGQLDTIYVNEGDFEKAGESIGTIGTPTDSFEKEGSHLYFQMLQKEQPVDPLLYVE